MNTQAPIGTTPIGVIVDESLAIKRLPTRKNNMTLLACMYMAGLVRPTLIPSTPERVKLEPTPVPMNKLSLETQAIKIKKAEDKRHARQVKRIMHQK